MKDQVTALLTPVVTQCGLDLEAVDVVPAGKRRLLRIVVDGDGPRGGGPSLDDIAAATRAISTALDATDVLGEHPYTLEVSSRGVDRPLTLPRHWRRNGGRLVAVTLPGGDVVRGRIVSSTDSAVVLDIDGSRREVAFGEVAKALVQVELNRPSPEIEEED